MCIQNKNKKLLLFLSYQKNIFSWVKIFKKFGDAEITEIKKVDFYNSKEMIDEMSVEIQTKSNGRPQACDFIKKEALAQVFFCKLCERFKNTFFTEDLRTTASENQPKIL